MAICAGGIIEDTRNKIGQHEVKNEWWAAHGVEVKRKKLDFGDYQDASGASNTSVDTKQNMQELAMDVGKDHQRFVRELERAREAGYRLVVLVEEHPEYSDRAKMAAWVSTTCRMCRRCHPHKSQGCKRYRAKPMQGATVAKIISTLEERHGARFEFCRKRDTARRVCELLGVEYDP